MRALHKLDAFPVLILDDVGYMQQSPEEGEDLSDRIRRRPIPSEEALPLARQIGSSTSL